MRISMFTSCAAVFIVLLGGLAAAEGSAVPPLAPAAQSPASSTTAAIDISEVRARVLQRSSSLKKAGVSVSAALLAQKTQSLSALPSMTLNGAGAFSYPKGTSASFSAGLSLSETIWDGGKSAVLASIDALATSSARASARVAYFAAIESADDAYYAVLKAADALNAAMSDLTDSEASLALAKGKFEAGLTVKADLLKAESEESARNITVSQARSALRAAKMTLASITGLSYGAPLKEIDFASYSDLMSRLSGMDEAALEKLASTLVAQATKSNPSIAVASFASSEAELGVKAAKAAYLPSISATMSNKLSLAGSAAPDFAGSISVAASVPLDIWNTGSAVQAKLLSAESAAEDATEAKRALELEIRSELYTWVTEAESVFSAQKALDYAESNYESVLELYKLSSASALDLSNAATLVSSDRQALNLARYGFLMSISSLRTYAGVETDAELFGLLP